MIMAVANENQQQQQQERMMINDDGGNTAAVSVACIPTDDEMPAAGEAAGCQLLLASGNLQQQQVGCGEQANQSIDTTTTTMHQNIEHREVKTNNLQTITSTTKTVKLEPDLEALTATATATAAAQKTQAVENCCASCRMPIRDRFMFSVIEQNFHKHCVRCSDCLAELQDRCFALDGKLYCRLDYWRRFGPKCSACQELIKPTELVHKLQKQNLVYHLNCFFCQDCKRHLQTGEQLHLIDERRLLCSRDFLLNTYHHSHHQQQQQHHHSQAVNQNQRLDQQEICLLQQKQQQQDENYLQRSPLLSLSGVVDSVDVVRSNPITIGGSNRNQTTATKERSKQSSAGKMTELNKSTNKQATVIWTSGNKTTAPPNRPTKQAFSASAPPQQPTATATTTTTTTNQQHQHTTSTGRIDGRRGPKRPRTILTTSQRKAFRNSFDLSQKPCRKVREALAKETGLSVRIVQVWFQNQRAKLKKMQRKQLPTQPQQQLQQQQMHSSAASSAGQLLSCSSPSSTSTTTTTASNGSSSHLISLAHLQQQQQQQSHPFQANNSSMMNPAIYSQQQTNHQQMMQHQQQQPPMAQQQQRRQRQLPSNQAPLTGQAAALPLCNAYQEAGASSNMGPSNHKMTNNRHARRQRLSSSSHRTMNESEGELSRSVSELEMSDDDDDDDEDNYEEAEEEDDDVEDDDEDPDEDDDEDDDDDDDEDELVQEEQDEDQAGDELDGAKTTGRHQVDGVVDLNDDDLRIKTTNERCEEENRSYCGGTNKRRISSRPSSGGETTRQTTNYSNQTITSGSNSLLREQQTPFLGATNQMEATTIQEQDQFMLKMQMFAPAAD